MRTPPVIIGFILALCFSSPKAVAYNPKHTADSSLLSVEVSSTSFFDNLEFFNPIKEGYTLVGFNIEPRVAYSISPIAKISAGIHSLYYAGEPGLATFQPVLTFEALLAPQVRFLIGTIDASNAHGMPEVLFDPERELIDQPETGLQFFFDSKFFKGQTWINWEQFIFMGDTVQEEFTVGFSAMLNAIPNGPLDISFPLYAIIVHHGGQINQSKPGESAVTQMNLSAGLRVSHELNSNQWLGVELLGIQNLNPSPPHEHQVRIYAYDRGWGLYPKLFLSTNRLYGDIGYWRATNMVLPRGDYIFGGQSTIDPSQNQPRRELVTMAWHYTTKIAKGFSLMAGADFYLEVPANHLDYSFSIIARFDESFRLKK